MTYSDIDRLYKEALEQQREMTARLLYFDEKTLSMLFLKRAEKQSLPSHLEPPGGRVEENELPLDAIIRELEEETRIKADKNKVRFLSYFDFITAQGKSVREFLFFTKGSKKEVVVHDAEHSDSAWLFFHELPTALIHPMIKNFLLENRAWIINQL